MKIETIEQAIAVIESAGYLVTTIDCSDHVVIYKIRDADNRYYIRAKDYGFENTATIWFQDNLIEFARKCQLKAFW